MAELKIKADSGGGSVSLKGPASSGATPSWRLPSADGSSGQFLKTDGSGVMSWGTVSSTPEGTAILSTGESGGSKYLREDGDGTCSWQTVASPGGATGLDVNDNVKVRFGTGNDFEIYHDGSKNIFDGGLITTPKQPACIATRSGNQSFSSGTRKYELNSIHWERHQGSSNFDTSNYRFTCPVAGVYLIDITMNIYGFDGDDMWMSVKRNGSTSYYIVRKDDWTGDSQAHGGLLIDAEANDYFELWYWVSDSGTFSAGDNYIRFSIALLG